MSISTILSGKCAASPFQEEALGEFKLARIAGRPPSVAPFHSSIRDDQDKPRAENGPASEAAIPQDSGSVGVIPNTPGVAVARRPSERRSPPSSRALALVVLCLLFTGGVGVSMMIRAGQMAGWGSRAPTMGAHQASSSSQQVARATAQTPSLPDGSSTNPAQALDVATSANPLPRDTGNPAGTSIPVVATDVPLPNPPHSSAEISMFGTPHDVVTEAVNPDATIISKSEPEIAPLPPIKPRRLPLATKSVSAAPTSGNIPPAASKDAVKNSCQTVRRQRKWRGRFVILDSACVQPLGERSTRDLRPFEEAVP